MAIVRLLPSGRTIEVAAGTLLSEAIRGAGMPLGSSCRGEGACGWCRVQVLAAEGTLSPAGPREQAVLSRQRPTPRPSRSGGERYSERLACQARVLADLTVSTSYW